MQASKFDTLYRKLNEDMDTTSVYGVSTATQFSADTYAPGDARLPKIIGSKKKKKKTPVIRRSFPQGM